MLGSFPIGIEADLSSRGASELRSHAGHGNAYFGSKIKGDHHA